jgi:hypothetical protein
LFDTYIYPGPAIIIVTATVELYLLPVADKATFIIQKETTSPTDKAISKKNLSSDES